MSLIQNVSLPVAGQPPVGFALLAGGRRIATRVARFVLAISLLMGGTVSANPFNILYYGNSFTLGQGSTTSVPDLVSDIAVAAGYQAPNSIDASYDGTDFWFHADFNTDPISQSLAPGQQWDYVVMQNYSTTPTHIGSMAQHLQYGTQLYNEVAAHSPGVVPVLFETWARAAGADTYTGSPPDFPGGPPQMQAEVHDGYQQLATAIGPQARVAWVGDTFEAVNFDLSLYDPDLYHAQNLGTLIASLVIFESIYGGPALDDINLTDVLAGLGLSHDDGLYAEAAVGIAVPEPSTLALCSCATALLALHVGRRRFRPRAVAA